MHKDVVGCVDLVSHWINSQQENVYSPHLQKISLIITNNKELTWAKLYEENFNFVQGHSLTQTDRVTSWILELLTLQPKIHM